jgi:hypothetical protein
MPGPPRRYSIQISDADGASLLSIKTCWTEKERRTAFAQIQRLAGLPEVNVYTGRTTRRSTDRSIVED